MASLFLGQYAFAGDPDELTAAYDRFVGALPEDGLLFHACVRTADGIVVLDACPDKETFESFSTSEQMLGMMEEAGLPRPAVSHVGPVHRAQAEGGHRLV